VQVAPRPVGGREEQGRVKAALSVSVHQHNLQTRASPTGA
jgi:hypothetical protein